MATMMLRSTSVALLCLLTRPTFAEQGAKTNVDTISRLCSITAQTAKGKAINEALTQTLVSEMVGYYAPKTDCNWVPTNHEFGFSLIDVPVSACFTEATKKFGGMQVVDIECTPPTVDESGKRVMIYQPSKFKMPSGDIVSMPLVAVYDFDGFGKIVGMKNQFDTSVMLSMTQAAKNKATIAHLCANSKAMQGGVISEPLMKMLMSRTIEFYAPNVDCNWVSTNADFGFDLIGVPISTCFAQATQKFGGMQIVDFQCEEPTADTSGENVMMYQESKMKTPSGELISVPVTQKYRFNSAGKIVAMSNQFDTSVMSSMTKGGKNKASIERLCSISKILQGGKINDALMQELTSKMMGFYAAKVDCNFVSSSPHFGFNLVGVPISDCLAKASQKFSGLQMIATQCEEPAAGKSGKSVMSYQPWIMKLVTGEMMSVPVVAKYEFDDDGKIVAWSNQFDTSMMELSLMMQNRKLSMVSEMPANMSLVLVALFAGCLMGVIGFIRAFASRKQPSLAQDAYEQFK